MWVMWTPISSMWPIDGQATGRSAASRSRRPGDARPGGAVHIDVDLGGERPAALTPDGGRASLLARGAWDAQQRVEQFGADMALPYAVRS